jgi:hypothetical protein
LKRQAYRYRRTPNRWKYFRHLFEFPRFYGETMSARHRLYSYIRAFAALVLGYDDLHLFEKLRRGYKGLLGEPFAGALLPEERKEAATNG